jgi:hypothetical protein
MAHLVYPLWRLWDRPYTANRDITDHCQRAWPSFRTRGATTPRRRLARSSVRAQYPAARASSWSCRAVEGVLGVEEEDVRLAAAPGPAGHPSAAGQAGGQVGGEVRLARAGVAVENAQLGAGQVRPPQPVDGSNRDAVQVETGGASEGMGGPPGRW